MYFGNYELGKTRLGKCLKRSLSEHRSSPYMIKDLKQYLGGTIFIIFTHHFDKNKVENVSLRDV